jgi:hypothetical protein
MPGFWKQLRRSVDPRFHGVDSTLIERGIRGTAVIKAIEETNLLVGNTGHEQAVFQMSLRVSVPGHEPYDVDHRQTGGALVGAEVTVLVDPQNPQNLFVDWEASAEALRLRDVEVQMEGTGLPQPTSPPPPPGASPREYFDWQLRQGYITQEQYDMIVPNLPDR